jgi:cytochrome oxidase Cu insertion factor (SCO1/SenC/PrrC family)
MDRAMRMMLAAGITLLASGIAFMVYVGYLRNHPPTVAPAHKVSGGPLTIPAFSLVDQEGAARDRSILEGRVSVVWFMFTRCPIYCPAMSVQMADLQKRLKGSGVRFVAVSLDPANDTPQVLREYGGRYGVDWSSWTYLTEPAGKPVKRAGWNIYTDDLHQFAEEKPETHPGQGTEIDHAMNFFLVGPDGNVLEEGWFNSKVPSDMETLRDRALGAVAFYNDKGLLKQ